MTVHQTSKKDWPRQTWIYPRIHNFDFGFGLSMDAATKAHTIVPYFLQDNALVDYETIKTNPENADFAVVSYPNVCAGSYIPKISVNWTAYIASAEAEAKALIFNTMMINSSMLNRLDAFDKKTGADIEDILELTHETTDEQCYPLWNGTKLYETQGVMDYDALVPGLTTTQQPEGIAFDKEEFFDAMHYYTNKEMLKLVTQRMKTHTIMHETVPHGNMFIKQSGTQSVNSLCKFQHPYTFCGQLFSLPQGNDKSQFHIQTELTGTEHLTIKGFCRFYEYNPDFNFARA